MKFNREGRTMNILKKFFIKLNSSEVEKIKFYSQDPIGILSNNTLANRIYKNHCLLKAMQEFN